MFAILLSQILVETHEQYLFEGFGNALAEKRKAAL